MADTLWPEAGTLITGGASGMGFAVAERMIKHGPVVLADANEIGLQRAVDALRVKGASVSGVVCDITDAASVGTAFDLLAPDLAFGLVHAAGISPSMGSARAIFEVDLLGTALVLDAAQERLVAGSAAVCFSSIAGHIQIGDGSTVGVLDDTGHDGWFDRVIEAYPVAADRPEVAYCLAKLGVIRLCRQRSTAWGAVGSRVTSLSPGNITDTPMGLLELSQRPAMAETIRNTPLQRGGRADEIASVAEFLCSSAASYVTGTDIVVDGGVTGSRPE